jgi:hypothetical protein
MLDESMSRCGIRSLFPPRIADDVDQVPSTPGLREPDAKRDSRRDPLAGVTFAAFDALRRREFPKGLNASEERNSSVITVQMD